MNSYGVLKRNVTSENSKKPKKNITNLTFETIVHNIKVLAGDVWGDVLVFSGDVLVFSGDVLVFSGDVLGDVISDSRV